ncbi:MAG: T9SS type A sorting domain-containing protein, partial [Flavobacteriales bacterium]|nr:T9SS type A sorting domain-containing protein [Flavobacteriales bacterium]
NPWANTDDGSCVYPEDCTQNLVEFVTNGGFFPGEIAWYAYDLDFNYVASNDSLYFNSSMACIGDECLFIYLYDSFGDGWNGGSVDVYVNGTFLSSFTLDAGSSGTTMLSIGGGSCDIEGCTDPLALNYNYTATVDDGSCTYPEDCTNNFVTITINTQLWGSEVSWTLVNGDGTVAASGSGYNSWDTETQFVCLEDGCYELQMSDSWGDGWNGAYYMIYGAGVYAEGSLLYGDFGADIISVNSSCEVDGCTDPEALNFNPAATWDDGSCVYNDNDGFGGGTGWLNPEIEVALYPNPVSEEFVLNLNHLDGQRDINLQIVDVAGKVVWTQHIANSETMRTMNISTAALQAGYYFLQVENGSMSTVKTFVRQ